MRTRDCWTWMGQIASEQVVGVWIDVPQRSRFSKSGRGSLRPVRHRCRHFFGHQVNYREFQLHPSNISTSGNVELKVVSSKKVVASRYLTSSIRSSAIIEYFAISGSTSISFTTEPAIRFSIHHARCARSIRYIGCTCRRLVKESESLDQDDPFSID